MTDQHPITPPPDLVEQWYEAIDNSSTSWKQELATRAARWGADQELEACCEWLINEGHEYEHVVLRDARRPRPLSLKEQALETLRLMIVAETPPANQFRVGETWASPRGKHWYVVRIDRRGRALLRNVDKPHSRQYRGTLAIGTNITDAWLRINPPAP